MVLLTSVNRERCASKKGQDSIQVSFGPLGLTLVVCYCPMSRYDYILGTLTWSYTLTFLCEQELSSHILFFFLTKLFKHFRIIKPYTKLVRSASLVISLPPRMDRDETV